MIGFAKLAGSFAHHHGESFRTSLTASSAFDEKPPETPAQEVFPSYVQVLDLSKNLLLHWMFVFAADAGKRWRSAGLFGIKANRTTIGQEILAGIAGWQAVASSFASCERSHPKHFRKKKN